ncbi:MAG: HNH endonuclease signature motif containing protein, partial [Actinomycetota bacterium]
GCSHPARLSDIDHAKSWEEGGHTNPENLGFLCRRHHRLKTHGGWSLKSHADGSCTWTSPQGKELYVPARPVDQSAAAKR